MVRMTRPLGHLAVVAGLLVFASLFLGPRIYVDQTLFVGDGFFYVDPSFRVAVPPGAYVTKPRNFLTHVDNGLQIYPQLVHVQTSRDGGRTWSALDAGRELGYCWALAADPHDPDSWYVSAAPGPREAHSAGRAHGRLYRWDGAAWRELPVPGESMPYTLATLAGEVVCGMADGRLLRSRDRGESWQELTVTASIGAMALVA